MNETMTMRDQFAVQVLPAIWGSITSGGPLAAALISYAVADAMMEVRQMPPTNFDASTNNEPSEEF
jgi:hypothetical protein